MIQQGLKAKAAYNDSEPTAMSVPAHQKRRKVKNDTATGPTAP